MSVFLRTRGFLDFCSLSSHGHDKTKEYKDLAAEPLAH